MKTKTTLACLLPLFVALSLKGVAQSNTRQSGAGQKPVMLMNRIGPSASELYMANADGTAEHKLLPTKGFDYHASFSAEGRWIVFTSERVGDGQADIYRVHPDGTGLE